ncbi:MAG: hypothetical protein BWY04_00830 [candidate division CPR1 bacterium ADurb.Bin160]|uniref:Uncharacterized protein n=1 Tax=candidate division CPR1 bacterium ADurb.Bin160 TaxID=1852826 RepID=A0A1V5ZMW9_9BACT|nr:MAG: hypothetical protein BWY04_00830 [candidate division CPR1 bacterium ADurb.Bin160]
MFSGENSGSFHSKLTNLNDVRSPVNHSLVFISKLTTSSIESLNGFKLPHSALNKLPVILHFEPSQKNGLMSIVAGFIIISQVLNFIIEEKVVNE